MAKTKQSAITRIVDLLANEGQKIVDKELSKVSYTYRSLNLRDSYGWGGYVGGTFRLSSVIIHAKNIYNDHVRAVTTYCQRCFIKRDY